MSLKKGTFDAYIYVVFLSRVFILKYNAASLEKRDINLLKSIASPLYLLLPMLSVPNLSPTRFQERQDAA